VALTEELVHEQRGVRQQLNSFTVVTIIWHHITNTDVVKNKLISSYKTIQEIDISLLAVQWCFKDQRQIFKSTIVHNATETLNSNSAVANACMMVSV